MNTSFLKRTVNNAVFGVKKYSPEILAVVGVIGTVTSAVMACKATTKVSEILNESKKELDDINEITNDENISEEDYTENDHKRDLTIVYAQTGLKFAKLYGPSVALGVLSIGSLLTSNKILKKRNVALAAAYTTLDKSYKQYRNRVVERFGEELDRELKYNIKAKEIKETVVDENGKKKTVKKTISVVNPDDISDYARIFDHNCENWQNSAEHNLLFLRNQERYANDLLRTNGRLFLNEVYDMLGFQRTKAGQIVGWVYNENNPEGDNFVDFGLFETYREGVSNFINGYEPTVLLNFNPDGDVWQSM